MTEFTVPFHTVNTTNVREHWSKRARRAKFHRNGTWMVTRRHMGESPVIKDEIVVEMTRISPGVLDDDNLRPALKSIRDGVADAFGVPDNDPRIKWRYSQEKGKRGHHAVRIKITAAVGITRKP